MASRPVPSDEELLQSFLGGNKRAFEVLFRRYQGRIFGYLHRLVRDEAAAEDLFQEVFLHLSQVAARFDGSRSFRSWFFCVAHNRAMDFLRKNRRRNKFEEVKEEVLSSSADPSPEKLAMEAEFSRILDRMFQTLSAEHRATLLLRFNEGLTHEEIAEVMNCPVGTAKSRTRNALRRIREMMEKEN